MNGIKITKEHFMTLKEKEQNLVLFECLECIQANFSKRNKINTTLTGIMGFFGGISAMVGKYIFFNK